MNFKHRDIEIEMTPSGHFRFQFDRNGRHHFDTRPSLVAAKKAIDKILDDTFEPFDAWVNSGWRSSREYKKVRIVGVRKTGKIRYGDKAVFVDEKNDTHSSVIRDAKGVEEKLDAIARHEKETEKIKTERQKALDKLTDAIDWVKADK